MALVVLLHPALIIFPNICPTCENKVKTKLLETYYFFTDLWTKARLYLLFFQNEDCIKVPGKYGRILDMYDRVSSVMELLLWWVTFQNDEESETF